MALQTWALSVCIIAVLLTLNFSTLKQFIYSLLKFDSKEKFIYLVLFITEHYLFCKRLPVLPVFCCKNNAVQYRLLRWVKYHEKIELWWRYELRLTSGDKMEFTLLSEAICRPKVVQIAPRSTYKKSGRWITNWQFLLVKVVCVTFFESSQPVWDVHVRIHVAPPSVLPIC